MTTDSLFKVPGDDGAFAVTVPVESSGAQLAILPSGQTTNSGGNCGRSAVQVYNCHQPTKLPRHGVASRQYLHEHCCMTLQDCLSSLKFKTPYAASLTNTIMAD